MVYLLSVVPPAKLSRRNQSMHAPVLKGCGVHRCTYQSRLGLLVHVNFQVRGHAGNELKCVTDVIQLGSSACLTGHTTLNVQLSDPSIDSSFHGRPIEFQSWNYISSVL